ncbi:MAG: DUF2934 domain-containing protein [Gallionellaceae bacterium]
MATAAKKPAVTAEKKTAVKKVAPKATAAKASAVKPAAKAATKPAVKKAVPAKSVAVTTEAKPKKAPAKKAATVSISPEHRYHMIATAAYYIAERRGFSGSYEMQDWISAEAEIDAKLKA